MARNRIKVESQDSEGKDVTVYVTRPTPKLLREAQIVASATFKQCTSSGALWKKELAEHMTNRGLWDNDQQKELDKLELAIATNREKLRQGKKAGLNKISAAIELAIDIRRDVIKHTVLSSIMREHEGLTAESICEDAKFDFLVSHCIKDEEGEKVFDSVEAYHSKQSEKYASQAASQLSMLIYDLDNDWEKKLPENIFLSKFGFVDDELNLVNKEGHKVDVDGKLVDDEGYVVNDKGERVDIEGNVVDNNFEEYGNFEDDLGVVKPEISEEPKEEVKTQPEVKSKKKAKSSAK